MIALLNEIIDMFLDMAPYMLLGLLFVAVLNVLFTKDLIARHVGKNNLASVFKAAIFGVPLPLCSCGVIPSTVYLANNGASKGSVISFLISTPQTGIDSIIATYGMMGWVFAIFRPFAALIMGVTGGAFFPKFVKDNVESDKKKNDSASIEKRENKSFKEKLRQTIDYSFVEFLDGISGHFMFGVIIAGLIAFFIPDNFFADTTFNNGIAGMLLMIIIGIPMYICSTSSIPIAVSLIMKGISPGVAFVFLAVGPATNAASLAIIANALGKKTAIYYVAVISILSIAFGYLLDYIIFSFGIDALSLIHHGEHGMLLGPETKIILGIIFFIMILLSFYRKYISHRINKKDMEMEHSKATKIKIEGMNCVHCANTVKDAISKNDGVGDIEVILSDQAAFVDGKFDLSAVKSSIESAGYKVVEDNRD